MSEFLTVAEVARECRIHPITVRRHIAAGQLKAVRIGRSVRVRREDLENYLSHDVTRYPRQIRTGIITGDDPLFQMIGIVDDADAADLSENKYKYLAKAMDHNADRGDGDDQE
jgi:excisionase family DNA binding protein